MTRIFIEDQELDIDKGLSNQITYAIDDLSNLDSKATAFSKTIVLPGTANNNSLLGNIFDFNNSNFTNDSLPNVSYNFNASRSAKCRIEVNGLQVMKGVLRLMEIIIDNGVEYECAVFGELGGFVAKLGNLRLEDMDFSAYDHQYAVSGITGSWTNANGGTGLYYPLIDYGTYSTGAYGTAKKDYQYGTFRPALHVKEYIDKIITGAGYTYESTFFGTDLFKRLIIPNNQKELFVPKLQVFSTTAAPTYSLSQFAGITVDSISFPGFTGGLFTTGDNKVFTYSGGSANYKFSLILSGTLTIYSGIGSSVRHISVSIKILKNGVVAFDNGVSYSQINRPGSTTFLYNEAPVISLTTADTFEVQITTESIGPNFTNVTVSGTSLYLDSPVPVLSPAVLNDQILMNEILPKNIFQKDFFTSVLKMFNLLVTEDKEIEKHLIVEPYVNFFDTSPSSYIDWSSKVDHSSVIKIKPMSEINARYYNLKFKGDTDYYNDNYKKRYNEGYGDRVYDNGFEFAKETSNAEVIFSSSVLVGYVGEDKVVPTIFKKNNALEDKVEHIIRIMQSKKVTGVTSWQIMNGATNLGSQTDYPYAGHLDDPDAPNADINFGIPKELQFTLVSGDLSNNLFNAYYSPYFAEITDKDSRLVTVKVKLTETDIFNLDFSKFIYFSGGLYRVNKIIDFVPGGMEVTEVELLKVINTTY